MGEHPPITKLLNVFNLSLQQRSSNGSGNPGLADVGDLFQRLGASSPQATGEILSCKPVEFISDHALITLHWTELKMASDSEKVHPEEPRTTSPWIHGVKVGGKKTRQIFIYISYTARKGGRGWTKKQVCSQFGIDNNTIVILNLPFAGDWRSKFRLGDVSGGGSRSQGWIFHPTLPRCQVIGIIVIIVVIVVIIVVIVILIVLVFIIISTTGIEWGWSKLSWRVLPGHALPHKEQCEFVTLVTSATSVTLVMPQCHATQGAMWVYQTLLHTMESRKEPEAKWGQSQCIVGKAPTLFVNSALPTQHWIPKNTHALWWEIVW